MSSSTKASTVGRSVASADVRTSLQKRLAAADGHDVLIRTAQELKRSGAPATLLSLELWAHAVADPQGEVAQGLARFGASGTPFTEDAVIALSRRLLEPRRRESDLRATAEALGVQIENTASALAEAQRFTTAYSRILAIAGAALAPGADGSAKPELAPMTATLASATERVIDDGATLIARLETAARALKRVEERFSGPPKAMVDALTAMFNRQAFDAALQEALAVPATSSAANTQILAIVDVDDLKLLHDKWGAATADDVIRYVGGALETLGAPPGIAARYGAESFALIMAGSTTGSAIIQLNRVRREIAERHLTRRSDGEPLPPVTISVGVSSIRAGDTRTTLLERVDRALYASKKAGRNQVTVLERLESSLN